MRILIISTTLTVVCVGVGAVLSSPLSPVSADIAGQPVYHHRVVASVASVPDTSAVDTEDAVVQRVGQSDPGAAATGPASPSASGTPTPGSGPTLPTLPTDVTSILPSIGPDSTPLGTPTGSPTPSASSSASPSASPTGGPGPSSSPSASPTGSDGDGERGGDDHDGGLVCLLLPLLCG